MLEELKQIREALAILADEDRNSAGEYITDETDRLGYPVIERGTDIAAEALATLTRLIEQAEAMQELPTDEMCDAARGFILGFNVGIHHYDKMREHLRMGGYGVPDWMLEREGHITKWEKAECIWRLMSAAQPPAKQKNGVVYMADDSAEWTIPAPLPNSVQEYLDNPEKFPGTKLHIITNSPQQKDGE